MEQHEFLSGVVEGFYGKPWTRGERLQLFGQIAELGLNTYFYAPKDDLKHRAIWRELYDDSELSVLRELVETCHRHGLTFIYGLSPGLDFRFGDSADTDRIKARFDQLRGLGVVHFALLFDDLPVHKGQGERRDYSSLAAAHCDVTNAVFARMRTQSAEARFFFCPTPYCDQMDRAHVGGASYLDDVGRLLSPEVEVFWTGPEIVSKEISVGSIERITKRIGREPVIWDNLFANDYDFRRVHCGPYCGRSRELRHVTRGMLVNLNNEFPINYIPLRTLAAFLSGAGEWNAREAFLKYAADWQTCFETASRTHFTLDDLILLGDCFYLPHAVGPEAQKLLDVIEHLFTHAVDSWGDARDRFTAINNRIQSAFGRLTELRDRELFHAWSRYGWSLKEELQVIETVIALKETSGDISTGLELGTLLPGTYRGGLIMKLEQFLDIDAQGMARSRTSLR